MFVMRMVAIAAALPVRVTVCSFLFGGKMVAGLLVKLGHDVCGTHVPAGFFA
jgi:hypothetical protein